MIIKKYYKLIRVSHEDSDYLRLKNVSNESGIFKIVKLGNPNAPNLEYSLDGTTWTAYDFTTLPEVIVGAGANIYFRGTNASGFNTTYNALFSFSFNKTCEAHGNMCSLLNSDPAVFTSITTIIGLRDIFRGMTTLTTVPNIGNATTIDSAGLERTFSGCTAITECLDLSGIKTLTGVGPLSNTFMGCTNITNGADLSGITSITASDAVYQLYSGCRMLYSATAPNISDLNSTLLNSWLINAGTSVPAGTTKVVNVPTGATITTGSANGIPTGWTRVDY